MLNYDIDLDIDFNFNRCNVISLSNSNIRLRPSPSPPGCDPQGAQRLQEHRDGGARRESNLHEVCVRAFIHEHCSTALWMCELWILRSCNSQLCWGLRLSVCGCFSFICVPFGWRLGSIDLNILFRDDEALSPPPSRVSATELLRTQTTPQRFWMYCAGHQRKKKKKKKKTKRL